MNYYQKNKERIAQQQRAHREIPEVKQRIRERERLTKRSVNKTLEIHEELLKHDRSRLKQFFIENQIQKLLVTIENNKNELEEGLKEEEELNTNKTNKDR